MSLLLLLACTSHPADTGEASVPPDDSGSDTGADTDSDTGPPFDATAAVGDNPDNSFSALVTVTPNQDTTVHVRYGEAALDHETLPVLVHAGVAAVLPVLGLHASRSYLVEVDADGGWTSPTLSYTTAPVPPNFPVCTATFVVPEGAFGADEALCSNFQGSDGHHLYACFDRWAQPVFSARTADDDSMRSMTRLADRSWASTGFTTAKVLWLDTAGAETAERTIDWFEGRTRFDHQFVDPHELLEIAEGPWAGAVVFATSPAEDLPGGGYVVGNGFIVYDRATDTVLYDYSLLGDTSDGVSFDPRIPFTRTGIGDYPEDWSHLNAMAYGRDVDGRLFFLLSLKAQDWIVKLYPDTDEIGWIAGFEGDFTLVDDLDASSPVALADIDWPFHAHGLSWVAHDGARLRWMLFDNGYPRHDGDAIEWDLAYSRVVEFDIDEETRLASTPFVYTGGGEVFFSSTGGNAELLPDGTRVLFLDSEAQTAQEIGYPGGEDRWRMTCDYHGDAMYRIRWYPSL